MDDIDLVVRAHELAISDAQYTLNDYKEMLKEQECQLVRSVKEATDEKLEEIVKGEKE